MTELLVARGLGIAFGGVVALKDFDLTVAEGDLLGLIGPNGAGKTTAFNLLTGVLRPDRGAIHFAGREITREQPERRALAGMTRTFQNIRLFDELTVLQNVMAGAHGRHGASALAAVFGGPGLRRSEALIREKAEAAGVPIHHDPPTARALLATVEIGQEVAPEHYKAVAAAIRYAEKMRALAREKGWG